jgi:hypothetical protein
MRSNHPGAEQQYASIELIMLQIWISDEQSIPVLRD